MVGLARRLISTPATGVETPSVQRETRNTEAWQPSASAGQGGRATGAAAVKRYDGPGPTDIPVEVRRLGGSSVSFLADGGVLDVVPQGEVAYVLLLDVEEDRRRQGIATALYRAAQRWCLDNGVLWLQGQLENEEGIPLRIRDALPGATTTLWVNPRALSLAMEELGWEGDDVDYTLGDSDDEDAPPRPPYVDEDWAELSEQPKALLGVLARMGVEASECFLLMATRLRTRPEVETPEFAAWFEGSEVVEDGRPLVVYHGTDKVFWTFDPARTADGAFWFTSDLKGLEEGTLGAAGKGVVMPCYLACWKLAGWEEYERLTFDQLIAEGYDGVRLDDDFIVFDPTRIKSAEHNDGTFDPRNQDIRS